jgi:alkanesulfonate monooxygenase SsuD/methylene tetrahydromethanopterin reductase-like flavin-dependent oxidoreductase (luciferase family)
MKVAPGTASMLTCTPALMAMSAATWHLIAPGRSLLGLGVSTRMMVGNFASGLSRRVRCRFTLPPTS